MAYRGVVRHVRYWRGQVHKWSTVYHFQGTPTSALVAADAQTLLTADDKMCWGNSAAANGGSYECDLYNQSTGGVPIATYVAFNWQSPATWIAYSGASWGTGLSGFDATAENALLVEWAAGLSKSGKPVKLRKWYHAIPQTGAVGGAVQLGAANVSALQTAAANMVNVLGGKGLTLGSPSNRFAGAATVSPYFSNHQMPRGRRRLTVKNGKVYYGSFSVNAPQSVIQSIEASEGQNISND